MWWVAICLECFCFYFLGEDPKFQNLCGLQIKYDPGQKLQTQMPTELDSDMNE